MKFFAGLCCFRQDIASLPLWLGKRNMGFGQSIHSNILLKTYFFDSLRQRNKSAAFYYKSNIRKIQEKLTIIHPNSTQQPYNLSITNVNTLPSPFLLLALTLPPCRLAIHFTIESPKPAEPLSLLAGSA